MTELEQIEIEGFKGLEHVEFEPTDINLITGRNNTGKTSFLEAVNLLFNPAHFKDFGDNMGSVIHVDHDHSELRGETGEREVKAILRAPTSSEAENYFTELVSERVDYEVHFSSSFIEEEAIDIKNTINQRVQRLLEEKLTQAVIADLRDEMRVLSTDSDKFPYLLYGDTTRRLLRDIWREVAEGLKQEDLRDILIKNSSGLVGLMEFDSEKTELQLGFGRTPLRSPENTELASFVKSTNLTESIDRTDDEQEPIKIDDIGDFVKDTGLVDDLKTFTLDYLVFEDEEGEKDQIPYEFMGDGFKTIVGLLWKLLDENTENDVVLIEEPETHMHPGYIREVVYFLINLAREEDIQLFITTHDSDFINDFFTENLTDEEEAYLEEEFSLLRMEEDSAVVEDYETARENLKDLHLDLRGI